MTDDEIERIRARLDTADALDPREGGRVGRALLAALDVPVSSMPCVSAGGWRALRGLASRLGAVYTSSMPNDLDTNVLLRVSVEQRERWRTAAERAGLSLSAWLRGLADAATGAPERAPDGKATRPRKKIDAPA